MFEMGCSVYVLVLCVVCLSPLVASQLHVTFPADNSDLSIFVTRPDIRPPKLHVEIHKPQLASLGYWFVSAYSSLKVQPESPLFQPLQIGPYIYDSNGDLIWSGAHLVYGNRPTFDFKVVDTDNAQYLSFIISHQSHAKHLPQGAGVILDSSLTPCRNLSSRSASGLVDMHEFNVIENGKRALMITVQTHLQKLSFLKDNTVLHKIVEMGFVELEVATGETAFEWWSLDHINPMESYQGVSDDLETTWDWLHLNSVDKNANGDYLVSARFTNTIYKISRIDGSIIWRFGGKVSSFSLIGFNFSAQHDARFHESNDTITIISFLNNAASSSGNTSTYSSGMLVELNTDTMTATLLKEFIRPDKELTRLRGNMQLLPNSNAVISWSENAYTTEFASDGQHVLDAYFTSHRFVTYRAYKFNFTSKPVDKPVVKAFVYGETPETSTTVFYVSWNGATQVSSWRFFALTESSGDFSALATVSKVGFETTYMSFGYSKSGYVQALADDETVLGESIMIDFTLPTQWDKEGYGDTRSSELRRKPETLTFRISTLTADIRAVIHENSPISQFAFGVIVCMVIFTVFFIPRTDSWRRSRVFIQNV